MIQASRYYKMYWIWIIFTSLNEYLLDRGLGLVAKGIDWTCRKHMAQFLGYKYNIDVNLPVDTEQVHPTVTYTNWDVKSTTGRKNYFHLNKKNSTGRTHISCHWMTWEDMYLNQHWKAALVLTYSSISTQPRFNDWLNWLRGVCKVEFKLTKGSM